MNDQIKENNKKKKNIYMTKGSWLVKLSIVSQLFKSHFSLGFNY